MNKNPKKQISEKQGDDSEHTPFTAQTSTFNSGEKANIDISEGRFLKDGIKISMIQNLIMYNSEKA